MQPERIMATINGRMKRIEYFRLKANPNLYLLEFILAYFLVNYLSIIIIAVLTNIYNILQLLYYKSEDIKPQVVRQPTLEGQGLLITRSSNNLSWGQRVQSEGNNTQVRSPVPTPLTCRILTIAFC